VSEVLIKCLLDVILNQILFIRTKNRAFKAFEQRLN
jgi:hypothetical protein